MNVYNIQQILERCHPNICRDIMTSFDIFDKNDNKTIRMRIYSEYEHLFDVDTCQEAATYGRLECLKYAHDNGCPWNESTCTYAAVNRHLECLKYARDNGCPWNESVCSCAAYFGHLDCLKYAHENGCQWNKKTCQYAEWHGSLDCLKYAHENGCPH